MIVMVMDAPGKRRKEDLSGGGWASPNTTLQIMDYQKNRHTIEPHESWKRSDDDDDRGLLLCKGTTFYALCLRRRFSSTQA